MLYQMATGKWICTQCVLVFAIQFIQSGATTSVTIPQPTVNVIETQRAVLPCMYKTTGSPVFKNWYKGPNRSNYVSLLRFEDETSLYRNSTRFDISSDANLVISDTVLSDAGIYWCEIYGYDVGIDDGQVTLSVTEAVAPTKPSVTGDITASEGHSVSLICYSAGGLPNPIFSWKRDGQTISDNRYQFNEDKTMLTINTVQRSDHGTRLSCIVENFKGIKQTDVTLTIHYPPKQPVCTQLPQPSIHYLIDTRIEIKCQATGGNPLATLQWFNNTKVKETQPPDTGNTSTNEYVWNLQRNDNQATYTCKAINTATSTPPPSCQLGVFTVYFAPTVVLLTGGSSPKNKGESLVLTCTTGNSNPVATITWFKNGSAWSGNTYESTNNEETTGGDYHSYIRTQQLTISLQPNHNNATYQCKAKNAHFNEVSSEQMKLTVYFKPPTVSISGYTRSHNHGTQLTLTCTSDSSNPPSAIKWYKNGTEVISNDDETLNAPLEENGDYGGKKTTQGLTIKLRAAHNAAIFQCKSSTSQFNGTVDSVTRQIEVYFPPTAISLSRDKVNPVLEGQTLSLTCKTESSNPVAQISWYKNGSSLTESSDEIFGSTRQYGGIYNGKILEQSLLLTVQPYLNMMTYTCTGKNSQFNEEVESSNIQLIVHYVPFIINASQYQRIAADEGDLAQLTCKMNTNPQATLQWYRNGNKIEENNRTFTENTNEGTIATSVLQINGTKSEDHGNYTCYTVNSIGNATFTVILQGRTHPDPVTGIEVQATHSNLTVTWIPGFDGGAEQTFYIEYINSTHDIILRTPATSDITYTITDLEAQTEYEMTIISENELGTARSRSITFNTTAKPTTIPPYQMGEKSGDLALYAGTGGACAALIIMIVILTFLIYRERQRQLSRKGIQQTREHAAENQYGIDNPIMVTAELNETNKGTSRDDGKKYKPTKPKDNEETSAFPVYAQPTKGKKEKSTD